jgi:hypothetical protein
MVDCIGQCVVVVAVVVVSRKGESVWWEEVE